MQPQNYLRSYIRAHYIWLTFTGHCGIMKIQRWMKQNPCSDLSFNYLFNYSFGSLKRLTDLFCFVFRIVKETHMEIVVKTLSLWYNNMFWILTQILRTISGSSNPLNNEHKEFFSNICINCSVLKLSMIPLGDQKLQELLILLKFAAYILIEETAKLWLVSKSKYAIFPPLSKFLLHSEPQILCGFVNLTLRTPPLGALSLGCETDL